MAISISETRATERVIVALDVRTESEGALLIDALPHARFFKIGLEAITAGITARLIEMIMERGAQVFWDGKFHDITNTVVGAVEALPRGVTLFTLHASCGSATLRKAAATAEEYGRQAFAVTVLTDKTYEDLVALGLATPHHLRETEEVEAYERIHMEKLVLRYAQLAHDAGMNGIVCSPKELPILREAFPSDRLQIITPGIRPKWAAANDQKRVMTPFEAFKLGADRIVIGRPITDPPRGMTPADAFARVMDETVRGIAEHIPHVTTA